MWRFAKPRTPRKRRTPARQNAPRKQGTHYRGYTPADAHEAALLEAMWEAQHKFYKATRRYTPQTHNKAEAAIYLAEGQFLQARQAWKAYRDLLTA